MLRFFLLSVDFGILDLTEMSSVKTPHLGDTET